MKELSEIVTQKTAEMINNGTVEQLIEDNLKKTIASSVEGALRSYSDFGQHLTEKIQDSIQCATSHIELPVYNKFISEVVIDQFTKILQKNAATHLSELIESEIPCVTKSAKISDLINGVKEAWEGAAREHGRDSIEINVDERDAGEALYVTFNHPEYEFKNIRASFYNFNNDKKDTWHIGYINESSKGCVTNRLTDAATFCDREVLNLLFRYWAMRTEFEMDVDIETIYLCD